MSLLGKAQEWRNSVGTDGYTIINWRTNSSIVCGHWVGSGVGFCGAIGNIGGLGQGIS